MLQGVPHAQAAVGAERSAAGNAPGSLEPSDPLAAAARLPYAGRGVHVEWDSGPLHVSADDVVGSCAAALAGVPRGTAQLEVRAASDTPKARWGAALVAPVFAGGSVPWDAVGLSGSLETALTCAPSKNAALSASAGPAGGASATLRLAFLSLELRRGAPPALTAALPAADATVSADTSGGARLVVGTVPLGRGGGAGAALERLQRGRWRLRGTRATLRARGGVKFALETDGSDASSLRPSCEWRGVSARWRSGGRFTLSAKVGARDAPRGRLRTSVEVDTRPTPRLARVSIRLRRRRAGHDCELRAGLDGCWVRLSL